MLNKLTLSNYKCFKSQVPLWLGKVSLFTGYNSAGKSSVLQSLLLLAQSFDAENLENIHPKGRYLDLGHYRDLVCRYGKSDVISFCLSNNTEGQWREFEVDFSKCDDPLLGVVSDIKVDSVSLFGEIGTNTAPGDSEVSSGVRISPIPAEIISQLTDVNYISSGRVGLSSNILRVEKPKRFSVGNSGSNTINVLHDYPALINPDMLCPFRNPSTEPDHLMPAVSNWLAYIMDTDESLGIQESDIALSSDILEFRFKKDGEYILPQNVGFGLGYILSLITATLIARPGSILIIENPEAHLHPLAQSRLTQLLTKAADNGVQVMVETHSEHIVNGFRLTALQPEYNFSNADLAIHFFKNGKDPEELEIEPNGRIVNWPKGFFDQAQTDIAKIMMLGHSASVNSQKGE